MTDRRTVKSAMCQPKPRKYYLTGENISSNLTLHLSLTHLQCSKLREIFKDKPLDYPALIKHNYFSPKKTDLEAPHLLYESGCHNRPPLKSPKIGPNQSSASPSLFEVFAAILNLFL